MLEMIFVKKKIKKNSALWNLPIIQISAAKLKLKPRKWIMDIA